LKIHENINSPNYNTSKIWLITGGCGFIGTNLIEHLVNNYDYKIRVVDNLTVGTRQNLSRVCEFIETNEGIDNNKVELWVGDLNDEELALKSTKDVHCIIHLAANTGVEQSIKDPKKDCEINVMGTLNMLEAAKKNNVSHFVFASSNASVGECEPPIHEGIIPKPISPYGVSKLASERYCSAYSELFDIHTVALRFGNVYGPHSLHKSSVIAKFIKLALEGRACEVYGDGSQTRDFIYVDDLNNAICKAVKRCEGGETFQIASSKEYNIQEVANMLQKLLAKHGVEMTLIHGKERIGDIKRNYSNINKAKEILHWIPEIQLKEGLEKTIEHFIKWKNNL